MNAAPAKRAAFSTGAGIAGLAGATLPARNKRRTATPAPRAVVTEFLQGIFGAPALDGFGDPWDFVSAVKAIPTITEETIADAALSVIAIFGAGAIVSDPGNAKSELYFDQGGGNFVGRGGGRFGGGGGGDDDDTPWYFEDPDGDSHNFFIRGGLSGVFPLFVLTALSLYCFLFAKKPHLGMLFALIATGIGWGLFIATVVCVAGALLIFLGVDYAMQWKSGALAEKKEIGAATVLGGGLLNVTPDDQHAQPADRKMVSANANVTLPKGVQVMGTDAQLVQVELSPGESLSAEPGAMCYMSANVRSITRLEGGFLAGCSRLLAGEPFFLNNFQNVGKDGSDGYIALAGRREGDKIIVLDMDQLGNEFLCARDSYLCSKGTVEIGAASTLMQGQMGLRLFLSNQNTVFMQKLSGSGVACISGNGTVIRQELKPGQEMVVDARAVVGFQNSIGYQLRMMSSPLAALFGGEGLFFARLSGPGVFYLQSLPAARQDSGLSEEGEVAV